MRNSYLLVLAVLVVPAGCTAAEWYPGIIHAHTTFSDGALSPSLLAAAVKDKGGRFMIVTDHYDQIGRASKGLTPLAALEWVLVRPLSDFVPDGPYGFDNYHRQVSQLTADGEFVAIPGAEIATKWVDGTGNEAESHTLAIGEIRELDSRLLDEYSGKLGRQQNVIDKTRQWGMLPVAAHPSLLTLQHPKRIDYRYDIRPATEHEGDDLKDIHYRGLAGVEMWKAGADEVARDIDFYLRLIQEKFTPFVTSGRDYHIGTDIMNRVTWVYAEGLTTPRLLKAINEGRTYAAQHGARLVSMSPSPGEHVTTERATIKATVTFPSPTGSPKEFVIYRDGVEAAGSRQTKAKGVANYEYEWTDTQAAGQEYSYVLRVGEVLMTSPAHMIARMRIERIVFVDRETEQVCVMDSDGSHYGIVTTSDTAKDVPAWSPDGQKIAFSAWSPDGRNPAFAKMRGGSRICVINADGTDERLLTDETGSSSAPSWSPDGRTITFDRQPLGADAYSSEIWVMDAGGTDGRRIGFGRQPSWSPDGSRVVFIRSSRLTDRLCTMDGRGGDIRVLHEFSPLGFNASHPAWSPDGTRIVLGDSERIWLLDPDGKIITSFGWSNLHHVYYPSWTPDGGNILFCSMTDDSPPRHYIWLMEADGSQPRRIENGSHFSSQPRWSPRPVSQ